MKKTVALGVAVLVLMVAGLAGAEGLALQFKEGEAPGGSTWWGPYYVSYVEFFNGQTATIYMAGGYYVNYAGADYLSMVNLALTARASGRPIYIYTDGSYIYGVGVS